MNPVRTATSEAVKAAKSWEPVLKHATRPGSRIDSKKRYNSGEGSPSVLPSDLCEQEILTLQHLLICHGFGTLFHMPIESILECGGKVLDNGCGSGAWARDVAKKYRNAEVVGLDINKTTFEDAEILPNMRFVEVNMLQRLPFEDNTFDAVYQRFMIMRIPHGEWEHAVKELKRVTKPGGYIELVELSSELFNPGPNMKFLQIACEQGMSYRGIDIHAGLRLDEYLRNAGLEVVEQNLHSAPIGWGGRLGELHRLNIEAGWIEFRPFLCKILNISAEKYDSIAAQAMVECQSYKTYINFYAAIGKVPLDK
jgi:SAM-dependent methyltransferase